jgi:metal-responsive CopG/Arc/MetJ family transcriptional regulator
MDKNMDKTTDLHLMLPKRLLANLNRLAKERKVKRAQLIRQALIEFVERLRAERVAEEMTEYADAMGDSSEDFVRETDDVNRLLRESEW